MRLRSSVAAVIVTSVVVASAAACGSGDDRAADDAASAPSDAPPSSTSTSSTSTTTTVATTTAVAPPPIGEAASPPSTRPAPTAPVTEPPPPPPTTPAPPYQWSVSVIDDAVRARMPLSWRPECPVPLGELRLVTVRHWNDAGEVATGEIVVHADSAEAIAAVFGELYAQRFPIARMELVDVYGADDNASMRANNTSAFNCRTVAGTSRWSEHSYGRAVDINPLVNPWVRGSQVDPPEGRPYADRRNQVSGGIYADDAVVRAFAAIGWQWGGYWSGSKDYQHFSANGR